MPLFMLMAKYSPEAMKAIIETGSDREKASKEAIEAAGGKMLGFYGMFGQDYNVAILADMPGNAEYIGAIAPAIASGALASWRTIPLYRAADVIKGAEIARKVAKTYQPPRS